MMIRLFISGMITGVLFLLGFSGGTMLMVLGLFTEVLAFTRGLARRKIYHGKRMLMLFSGMLVGMVVASPWIRYLLAQWTRPALYFLLGIVLMGAFLLRKEIKRVHLNVRDYLILACGFVGALLLMLPKPPGGVLFPASGVARWLWLFITGIPVAAALILPGISTTFVLLLFGIYDPLLAAISHFDLSFLLPFAVGVGSGTLLLAEVLDRLLQKAPSQTYLLIIGFVLASALDVFQEAGIPSGSEWWILPICLLCGAGLILFIEKTAMQTPDNTNTTIEKLEVNEKR